MTFVIMSVYLLCKHYELLPSIMNQKLKSNQWLQLVVLLSGANAVNYTTFLYSLIVYPILFFPSAYLMAKRLVEIS